MAALPHSRLVSVKEYLNTAYDPDVEYVDGVLVERVVGDWLHSLVQGNIVYALKHKFPHLKVAPELRSRVAETRFRLPDVCAVLTPPTTNYLVDAAYLAVEVLSPDDQMTKIMEKLREYNRKGVANIWVFDPREKTMFVYRDHALTEVLEDEIRTGDGQVALSRGEVFAE